jgi:hypothetical protein
MVVDHRDHAPAELVSRGAHKADALESRYLALDAGRAGAAAPDELTQMKSLARRRQQNSEHPCARDGSE